MGRRERERDRERTSICCLTYLCIHWLILACTLTRDQTDDRGDWNNTNQLSYLARARSTLQPSPQCSLSWKPVLYGLYEQKEVSAFFLLDPSLQSLFKQTVCLDQSHCSSQDDSLYTTPLLQPLISLVPSNLRVVIAPLPPRLGSSNIPVVPLCPALHICSSFLCG